MNNLLNTKDLIKNYLSSFKKINNIMRAPRIMQVTLSAGCGKFHKDEAKVKTVLSDLSMIGGQKAVISKAKKSVSNFKIREGMTSGVFVTLRGERMCDFLDLLTTVALPRSPYFTGLSVRSIAKNSNFVHGRLKGTTSLNIGVPSHLFPMASVSEKSTWGMNIAITIKGTNTEIRDIVSFLEHLGLPFRDFAKIQEPKEVS